MRPQVEPSAPSARRSGRLPLHMECAGMPTQRQRIWTALRRHQPATAEQLQEHAGKPWVSVDQVQHYLTELTAAGWVQQAVKPGRRRGGQQFTAASYVVARDAIEAPRTGKSATAGLGVLAMWRAMRALKEFDYQDVAAAASIPGCQVKASTAKTYLLLLARAKYFAVIRPATPGTPARYRLVRDTGAHAPAVTRRKCVFDRNLGAITWEQSVQEVGDVQ